MQKLNRQITNQPKRLPLKVLQFGGGNFLRAFVDWMVHVLNAETDFNGGVVVVKPTEHGDYSALKAQDGLFTVVLDGIKGDTLIAEKTVVSSVQKVVHAYTEWDAYLELAKNPDIRFVVSNTTEAGIQFSPEDKGTDAPPKEFPGKLTLWLYERFMYFQGAADKGCFLLPCELIEDNGETLKKIILAYAEHWRLGEDFKNWIYKSNHFCGTLVDRIVSGYPYDRAEEIQAELGYEDELLVAGESYHSWVIQGNEHLQNELPFPATDLNVDFVADLAPYREMKVRILNGAHTAMVPVGYLAGIRFVKDAMDDAEMSDFIASLLSEEVATTLDFPDQVKQKYIDDVLDRFRNPLLRHQLISIALNSTSKFVSRLLPTFKDYYLQNRQLPVRIVFALSALIRMYKGDFDGAIIALKDDAKTLNFFASNWKKYAAKEMNMNILVGVILSNQALWGEDLTRYEGLVDVVAANINSIEGIGLKKTIKKFRNDY